MINPVIALLLRVSRLAFLSVIIHRHANLTVAYDVFDHIQWYAHRVAERDTQATQIMELWGLVS